MIDASIMESMDCSNQNTESKMFGSTNKSYVDFCCVPVVLIKEGMVGAVILQISQGPQTTQRLDENDP